MPDLYVIGGPNGAGKTTAARELIPVDLGLREFVNADEIARGLSPFNPEGVAITAGRLMLSRISQLRRAGESFAFESTLAGRQHARWLEAAKREGWRVALIFLWLPDADLAVGRVARRVREGGHAIDEVTIRRRYAAGLKNLVGLYLPLADIATIYDNSGARRLVVQIERDRLMIHDPAVWARIQEQGQ